MEGSSSVDTRIGERGAPRVSVGKAGVGREPRLPYRSILMAVDCSDHSNRGVSETLALAGLADAGVTAIHVYAARMHDMRFRQMEGGLPERYRQQEALEQQRDIHNELITRGLTLISESYLEAAARACREASIPFTPCTAEGKNYRELARETNSGRHDLLVIGAEGLGAGPGSGLGTVCERVMRRATIDTLVIKDPKRRLAEGPIVVAIDGSDHSFGGLTTALVLAQSWGVPLQVVAAYDPHFHYVAFNRISRVLSEEASRTFRFKEQERLHEEIIDAGLAKIYRAHLDIARSIAAESGATIETLLLDGKPHAAIEKHLRAVQPSLLVVGALGIHADADLDIGGNAERLLRNVDCAVLLSRRSHRPRIDTVAAVTTIWTDEAERRMERVPEFARKMARMAILQYAQERGHTMITENIVEEATARLCPGHAPKATGAGNKAGDAGAGNEDPGASDQR
ncbi:MAG: universal stress protein [Betaproteobacteria bacterium]|nr:universal stress protein [Betaproteobacteria bacterium]